MIGACIENDIVTNIIVMKEEQTEELSAALGCEIVDARPYGLAIGDVRQGGKWMRNAGGDLQILEELDPVSYESCALYMRKALGAQRYVMEVLSGETRDESEPQLMEIRKTLDRFVQTLDTGDAATVNENAAALREWVPGSYKIDDLRRYQGTAYRCCQAHDSTGNVEWAPPNVPALWVAYHGTSKETAHEWIAPQGAHDAYQENEWCTYGERYYQCTQNANVQKPTGEGWMDKGEKEKGES